MSDSVDRVFNHALNTVNKIRTGSQKPPSSTRLKLYGLYKQSMEGDVEGIMQRPEGQGDEAYRACGKWDAWEAQRGLSRTEAKRRYINHLIETMHVYASPSPDARELVAELEFVWDQVKSNVPSSSSSSPAQRFEPRGEPYRDRDIGSSRSGQSVSSPTRPSMPGIMQTLSGAPEHEEDVDETADEFVDAQDSQYDPAAVQGMDRVANPANESSHARQPSRPANSDAPDQRWQKRMEKALVKMTAEVAALREQLESRRLFSQSRQKTVLAWLKWIAYAAFKHFALDMVLVGLLILWMRRKKDPRLEVTVRMLLGDAAHQVQKARAAKLPRAPKLSLPKIATKKS